MKTSIVALLALLPASFRALFVAAAAIEARRWGGGTISISITMGERPPLLSKRRSARVLLPANELIQRNEHCPISEQWTCHVAILP